MTNLKRFQNALSEAGAECAIISSEINQRYISDFRFSDGYVLVTVDEAFLLTDSRYIEAARAAVTELSVMLASAIEIVPRTMREKRLSLSVVY